jgi:hypothetical protein
MSTQVQDVFDKMLTLIDAVDDADVSDYENRTIGIINVLIGELYMYSDNWKITERGKRPICPEVAEMEDIIQLDDYICRTVMPYGLAAHLMLQEDTTTAAYCQQRYDELKNKLASGLPQDSEDVVDVYAGGHGDGMYYNSATGEWEYIRSNGIGFEWTTRW